MSQSAETGQAGVNAFSQGADRRVQRLALAMALLPLAVSAIVLVLDIGNGYLPTADHALTEMQVRDVGRHEVLIGLYSRADWAHPGPIYFYLLAPLYRLAGGTSIAMNLGALFINGASITGMAVIARRKGDTPLMLCTLLGCSLVVRTLGAEFIHDPWNNYVTVLPFGLMIFLAWAMSAGDTWALPVATAVASFLAQTHVSFVALALPLLAWGAGWLAVLAVRSTADPARRRDLVRSALLSIAILAVLWAPPLLDVVLHDPSNAERTVRWFGEEEGGTHTAVDGWRVITGQFGLEPEWLTNPRRPFILTGESSHLYSPLRPWLLLLAGAAGWLLWRRRRTDGWRLVMTVGAALGLGVFAVARTVGPAFDYRLRWTWMPAMVAFVAIAWAGWLVVWGRFRNGGRWLTVVAVASLLVLTGVNTANAARAGTPQGPESAALEALIPPVLEAVGTGDGEVLVTDTLNGSWYTRGLVLQLERSGVEARVPPDRADLFGEHRVRRRGEVRARLLVAVDAELFALVDQSGLRLLARWSTVSDQEAARIERRGAELNANLRSGRISSFEHSKETGELTADVPRAGRAGIYAVAVFLDERPGDPPDPP